MSLKIKDFSTPAFSENDKVQEVKIPSKPYR
jgi:hypothetical protein